MPDIQISEKLINFLVFLPLFFVSISIHEFSHAYFANRYGDDTARKSGRLTLNPIRHLDIVGSIIMPLAAFASGWALPNGPPNQIGLHRVVEHTIICVG